MVENPEEFAVEAEAEAAQVALRQSIDRAREIVGEAKIKIGEAAPQPIPPNPAT